MLGSPKHVKVKPSLKVWKQAVPAWPAIKPPHVVAGQTVRSVVILQLLRAHAATSSPQRVSSVVSLTQ